MQTQQIFGVSGGGMMYSAKTGPAKTSENSFDQLIQMSQNAGAVQEQPAKPVETKKESAADVAKAEQPEKPAETSAEKKDTAATAEEKPELTKADGTKEADDVEAAERAAGILNQVAEAIKDILELSEEELNQFMEQLGISNVELIQPETIQNLVLMANSEQDAVVLLTDAQLLSTVNELVNQVEQILQEAGVTPEDLLNAFQNPDFEAPVDEAVSKLETAEDEVEKDSTKVENVGLEASEEKETVKFEIHTEGKETGSSAEKQGSENSTEVDNFANHFVQNLTNAAEEISEITGQKNMVQMIREIADQMLEQIKVSVTSETTSLEIVLTPEELGRVNLTVTAEQDGTMKASFVTENEITKEALEHNLVQFKEALQEQGLKIDSIEVTVGNFSFDKNSQTDAGSGEKQKHGNRRFVTDEEISQQDETDQLARIFMDGGESTVNYMA